MSTLTNETTLGETPLKNLTLSSSKEGKLPPLTEENIVEIQKSIDFNDSTTIRLPVQNQESYSIFQDETGFFRAYLNCLYPDGTIVQFYDPTVIIEFYGENAFLFRYFSKDGNVLNSKIEEEIQVLEETTSNSLSLESSIQLPEEEIRKYTTLLIMLALFKKSIIESNGNENLKYSEILNRILEDLRSKEFNPDKNESYIMSILIPITKKNKSVTDKDKIYRNSKGRLIEDLKSILKFLGLLIPDHPNNIDGHKLGLKHPKFPYEYYEDQLLNIIKDNLKNPTIRRKMSILMSLWDQTNGLEVFVDEVRNYE